MIDDPECSSQKRYQLGCVPLWISTLDLAWCQPAQYFELKPKQLDTLCYAITHHSGGEVSTDATIQTCWDGDRLDLGRVGIMPSPKYLSDEAHCYIDTAFEMSIRDHQSFSEG